MSTNSDVVVQIPIKEIVVSTTNPRKHINETELIAFAADIKSDGGVRQPIKVRKNAKGKYEIIYGERRYRASVLNKAEFIPGFVVEMEDLEVEKEQFIENMNRADVHPMDEGFKFSQMMSRKVNPVAVEDIAKMINRSVSYVLQRAELSNMIEKFQKDFWADKFPISFAIQLARLTPEAQKFLNPKLTTYEGKYQTTSYLIDLIDRYIKRDLKTAVFDTKNPDLDKKAGPCNLCPKRTGNNLLFEDVKSKEVCMDGDCFENKLTIHTLNAMDQVRDKYPDILFVKEGSNSPIPKLVAKKLEDFKVGKISDSYDFGSKNSKGSTAVKVMFVDVNNLGKITTLYKNSNTATPGKKPDVKELVKKKAKAEDINEAIQVNISAIKDRQKRGLELDNEKIWSRIHTEIIENKDLKISDGPLSSIDIAAFLLAMFIKCNWDEKMYMALGVTKSGSMYLGESDQKKMFEAFKKATTKQIDKCIRTFIILQLDRAEGSAVTNASLGALKAFIEQYEGKAIKQIEADQAEIAKARIERSEERISSLKKQIVKPAAPAKSKPAVAKKK